MIYKFVFASLILGFKKQSLWFRIDCFGLTGICINRINETLPYFNNQIVRKKWLHFCQIHVSFFSRLKVFTKSFFGNGKTNEMNQILSTSCGFSWTCAWEIRKMNWSSAFRNRLTSWIRGSLFPATLTTKWQIFGGRGWSNKRSNNRLAKISANVSIRLRNY